MGDGEEVEVAKKTCCKKVLGSGPSDDAYSLDDLGDAEAYSEWDGADGSVSQLYVLPGVDGTGSRVFLVNGTDDEDATVNLVANTPMDLLADDVETDIALNDDGTLTIKMTNADGQVNVIKLKTQIGTDDDGLDGNLEVATPDGGIKVRIKSRD